MNENTVRTQDGAGREPPSIATYAVVIAMILVLVLSAVSWRIASGNAAAAESYIQPSLLQITDPD